MRELSLFSGAGGGLLGTHLLGWEAIGYVEFDDYCQRVLRARIDDGYLPVAPIFGDVREFIESGAAAEYRGLTDVVTAGFPCQPFSAAGKRQGADDERNMWPATVECIRVVRPRFCFMENVPGLLSSGYFGTILGDLVESGYDARWRVLSAAELGAPHRRNRLWIVAHRSGPGRQQDARGAHGDEGTDEGRASAQMHKPAGDGQGRGAGAVAHATGKGRMGERGQYRDSAPEGGGRNHHAQGSRGNGRWFVDTGAYEAVVHADNTGRGEQCRPVADAPRHEAAECAGWWQAEPTLGRVVDGVADRVGQLRALGNGQVPIVAATAWRLLTEGWDA